MNTLILNLDGTPSDTHLPFAAHFGGGGGGSGGGGGGGGSGGGGAGGGDGRDAPIKRRDNRRQSGVRTQTKAQLSAISARKSAADKAAKRAAAEAKAQAEQAAKKAQFTADTNLRLVKAGDAKTVSRLITRNPRRSELRRKARIGGSTQFEVPTIGVS